MLNFNKLMKTLQDSKKFSVDKLALVAELNPVCVVFTDINARIEYVNQAFVENTGYSREELIGQKPSVLKSGFHSNEFYNELWTKIQKGNTWKGIFQNKRKNGEYYWEKAVISPFRDEHGKITNFIGMKEDISNEVLATQKLMESEKKYKSLFEQNIDGIAIIDTYSLKIENYNQSFQKMFELGDIEFYNKSIGELSIKDYDGTNLLYKIRELLQKENNSELQKTLTGIYNNKVFKYLEIKLNTIVDDEIDYLQVIFRDVTDKMNNQKRSIQHKIQLEKLIQERTRELEKSNLRLQVALDNVNEGIWEWNLQKSELNFNNDWNKKLNSFGLELKGQISDWLKIIDENDYIEFHNILIDIFDKKRTNITYDHKLLVDNKINWFQIKGKVIEKDVDNNPLLIVGTHSNITSRKQYELELKDAKEKAEVGYKIKSEFLNSISHEIRTPMNGILGFVSLLDRSNLSENDKKFINIIKQSTHNLLDLMNNIIDISKIKVGDYHLVESEFEIKSVLLEILKNFEAHANTKNLKLEYDDLEILSINVKGDLEKFKMIFINLIDNAIRFTNSGTVKLQIKHVDKKEICYSIIDTGIGISEKNINAIFEEFSQVDMSSTRFYGGGGIGLSLVKAYINLFGGKISVKSKLNHGSEFTFCIPIQRV